MAYNSYFPANYQAANYQPNFFSPTFQQQQNNSSVIWVQGEAAAKSYLVAPNSTVQLWDSEKQVIYLKSADASGMPSMKVLDCTIRQQNEPRTTPMPQTTANQDYALKSELAEFKEQLDALRADIDSIALDRKPKKKGSDDERN